MSLRARPSEYSSKSKTAWPLLLLAGFSSLLILKAAWLSDDAYITLRTIDNFWNGYGLRWNVLERVQAYTDPLWMLLIGSFYGITREAYFTTIAVSLACVAATLVLLIRRLPPVAAGLAMLLLMSSRAFVEFSTSGLENPLSHLLLVWFWLEASASAVGSDSAETVRPVRRPTLFCLLVALCVLTRLDLALLVGPRLIAWLLSRPPRAWRWLAIGALPLIAWFAFATIYYGTPLPNTVLAKLNTGVPHAELMWQGLYYLQESLMHDPVTLPIIVIACVWAIATRSIDAVSLAAGLALHIAYVISVGGDFMSGRFLSAPFVCAALFLARHAAALSDAAAAPEHGEKVRFASRRVILAIASAAVIITSLIATASPLRVWRPEPTTPELFALPDFHGVLDERRFYYPFTGLWPVLQGTSEPAKHPWANGGVQARALPGVITFEAVGLLGYHAGPGVHVIDLMALADPLLARRPSLPHWRIGHFQRAVPDGYGDSIRACQQHLFPRGAVSPPAHNCLEWPDETNRIADAAIARQYDLIRLVTQGPLFTAARWRGILRLNTGW
jgi:arabinofuranosyltransferase